MGDLNFDCGPELLARTRALIVSALPLLAGIAGLRGATATKARELERLVLIEFDKYLAPALLAGEHPRYLKRKEFAAAANLSPAALDERYHSLGPQLAVCALAFPMILAARGDFLDGVACVLEQLDSPVGPDMSGPGVYKDTATGMMLERHVGPVFCGPDMRTHGLILPLLPSPNATTLCKRMTGEMLAPLVEVGKKIKSYPSTAEEMELTAQLAAFGIDSVALTGYAPQLDVLFPRLAVGRDLGRGAFEYLSPHVGKLREWLESAASRPSDDEQGLSIQRAVVEIEDEPHRRGLRWLNSAQLAELFGWAMASVRLEMNIRLVDTRYAYELEDGRGYALLHRYARGDNPGAPMSATHGSFAAIGFDLEPDSGDLGLKLAHAIGDVEAICWRTRTEEIAERFGKDLAPAFTRLEGDEGRRFVRSLRTIDHTALVVVEQAQARETGP